jgi:carbamoyl-phosphate synthase small subunit
LERRLVLKNGPAFDGKPLGADGDAIGEVVFNTGMTGYQEILSDPSYAGQMVVLTYPLIGNYGVNDDDFESDRIQPTALIVRESCETPSNWRSRSSLTTFLAIMGVPGIQGIDTRAVTKQIRSGGATMGIVTSRSESEARAILDSAQDYGEQNFVSQVSTAAPYAWGYQGREEIDEPVGEYRHRIAVLDCGLKFNILRRLAALHCRSVVFPHKVSADELLGWKPDGVLLSPGPGDPIHLTTVMQTVRELVGKVPLFGICLGNQMVAHALGGKTFKLKFGHRGSNHPVKDLRTGKATITSQNHGYAVDPDSLAGSSVEITQLNLNDGTVEGLQSESLGVHSIQYHPEAAPGPWDSRPYFEEFISRIERAGS